MQGQVVLITGCSTGIGRATAEMLAGAGCRVVATARRTESLEGLPVALKLRLDVTDPASVEAAVADVLQRFGRIDVLVNNAGFGQIAALEDLPDDLLERAFQVNVFGVARLVRAVLPAMRSQGAGRIINISSVVGRIAFPLMSSYCGSKFALEAISDAMRGELAGFGIKVIVVEPGAIATEFENTARASSQALWENPGSPYRKYYKALTEVMRSQNAKAPGPEVVARVIRRAIEAHRPRARYQAPAGVAWAVKLTALLPDRLYDWAIRRAFGAIERKP